jgi:ketosteroid isomerase-like protein
MTDPASVQLVHRYLDALIHQDWNAVRGTLAPDVVRLGPYNDNYTDREAYVEFLKATFAWMQEYAMDIARVWGTTDRACAELAETVTVDGRRLRTDEAIVFDVRDAQVTRVQVFLRQSVTS